MYMQDYDVLNDTEGTAILAIYGIGLSTEIEHGNFSNYCKPFHAWKEEGVSFLPSFIYIRTGWMEVPSQKEWDSGSCWTCHRPGRKLVTNYLQRRDLYHLQNPPSGRHAREKRMYDKEKGIILAIYDRWSLLDCESLSRMCLKQAD